MRVAIVGLGNQGHKWAQVISDEVVAIADPALAQANRYSRISSVPLDNYDAAIVCTPNDVKPEIVQYLIHSNKHVLVEKPLALPTILIQALKEEALKRKLVLQTSYNLRWEPNVQRVRDLLQEGILGKIYHCRMLYGYGTAQDVKDTWRDRELGVISEVATHLLDLAVFWFDETKIKFLNGEPTHLNAMRHELHNSYDWVKVSIGNWLDLEASWVCWENVFRADIYAENGSVHIDGLLKWGQSKYSRHLRKLPSGMPLKHTSIWNSRDESLFEQYRKFKRAALSDCYDPSVLVELDRDINISRALTEVKRQIRYA